MDDMNITAAKYMVDDEGNNGSIKATIDGVELSVPLDPHNRHYAEILRQVQDGLVIEEADNENE